MTKSQRRQHKAGNQVRRAIILFRGSHGDKADRSYFASTLGAIQKGKFACTVKEASQLGTLPA